MRNSVAVPQDQRYPNLHERLLRYANQITEIRRKSPQFAPEQQNLFLFLSYPWLEEGNNDPAKKAFLDMKRSEFKTAGFDGTSVKADLEDILRRDRHLRECCSTPLHLAHFFGAYFIAQAAYTSLLGGSGPILERLFEDFSKLIYDQGPFRKIALSHLFNFECEEPSLRFGNFRVERLDLPTVATILGEVTFPSFLHPPNVGDFFVAIEEEGPCDDIVQWLLEQRKKQIEFVRVLQYFKNGLLHIDYSVPHFLPQWVNQIRKWGIFFIGTPRRIPYAQGQNFYRLELTEVKELDRWFVAYQSPAIYNRIADERNKFRQSIMRAGDYYEASQSRGAPTERLVDLAISLESLFSPADQGEFTYRLSQGAAQLLGETPDDRATIFQQIKQMYGKRSKLLHGAYDINEYYEGRFVSNGEVETWASIIRRAIVRFLVLYLRSRDSRGAVLDEVWRAALDPAGADKLRAESDPLQFLAGLNPNV